MRNLTFVPAAALALLAASGCTFETGAAPGGDETLYERLGTRAYLSLQQPSLVGVAAYDRDGEPLPCVQPTVRGGQTVLRATGDGLLLLEGLDIDLGDITIEPGVILEQEPVRLTDIRLRLGTQVTIDARWDAGGARATGAGRGDLLMDWAILTEDGEALPLATQKIRDAELLVDAELLDDGEVIAEVSSTVDGTFWDFSAVELADLSMQVNATSAAVR